MGNPMCPKCKKELKYDAETGYWCECGWTPSIND